MKKVVLIFGLIAGIIAASMFIITLPFMLKGQMKGSEAIGWTTNILGLSCVFFGIKAYRDKYMGGVIKFGKAFLVGLYISLVASIIYAAGWELSLAVHNISGMDFMAYWAQTQAEAKFGANGSAEAVAAFKQTQLEGMQWYANPFLRFIASMTELFPVGLLIALISAALLKRKDFLPSNKSTNGR